MADDTILSLTPEFASALQEMYAAYRRGDFAGGGPNRDFDELGQPRGHLVALTPASGISPFTDLTGTGTDVPADTGTGYSEAFKLTSASCAVYRRVVKNHVEQLEAAGFSLTVYNLSPLGVEGHRMVTIVQDRWGDWYVTDPGLPYARCS